MDIDETSLYIIGAIIIAAIAGLIFFKYKSPGLPNEEHINHSETNKKTEDDNSAKDNRCVGDKCVMIPHD